MSASAPHALRSGSLTGVGVGPGDPDHLTLKALYAIRKADIVVSPSSEIDLEGRAENIVRQALPETTFKRIVFDMSPGETGAQARKRGAISAAKELVGLLEQGNNISFITLGDPNVFSTFSLVASEVARLNANIKIRSVPGIMAFQEVASRTGVNLLDDTEKLFLVTAFEGTSDVEESLQHPNAAVVIYKGGRHIQAIKDTLCAHERIDGAVVGELLGLEGESILPLAEVTAPAISYLATVIAPPKRTGPASNPAPSDKAQIIEQSEKSVI